MAKEIEKMRQNKNRSNIMIKIVLKKGQIVQHLSYLTVDPAM